MKRFSIVVCIVATLAAAIYLIATTPSLPDIVATKFYGGDKVGSLMSRSAYLWFMLALTIGMPVLIAGAIGWLPTIARLKRGSNFPNREYWLAPERHARTLDYLCIRGCWMGAVTAGFMFATHAFIFQAHAHQPPRAQLWPYAAIAVLFVAANFGFTLMLYLHFKRIPR